MRRHERRTGGCGGASASASSPSCGGACTDRRAQRELIFRGAPVLVALAGCFTQLSGLGESSAAIPALAMLGIVIAAPVAHFQQKWLLPSFALFNPFGGGGLFVLLQAVG